METKFPFASDLIQCAHVNRLLGCIYLSDQLTGRRLVQIKQYRREMPSASSAYSATNYKQVDALIATLDGQLATASRIFQEVASWYEDHNHLDDAAVAWLQYAWCILELDSVAAARMSIKAFGYMEAASFNSHQTRDAAVRILNEAQRDTLVRETLRAGIVLAVCPKVRLLQEPAGPCGPAINRSDPSSDGHQL